MPVEAFLAILAGALLVLVGPLIWERLTDGSAIRALARLVCPACAKAIGLPAAEEAAELVTRKNSGIAMIRGGYTPAVFHQSWDVTCPSCSASLVFHVVKRRVRVRRETGET